MIVDKKKHHEISVIQVRETGFCIRIDHSFSHSTYHSFTTARAAANRIRSQLIAWEDDDQEARGEG